MPVRSVRDLLTLNLLLCSSTVSGGDPEHVSIQTLFSSQAMFYQQHAVTVEGVTSDLQTVPPFAGTYSPPTRYRCILYGQATFVLEDETRLIPVDVLGSCIQKQWMPLPHDGDRVRMTGLVHVLKSEAPRQLRIQAMTIQILKSIP